MQPGKINERTHRLLGSSPGVGDIDAYETTDDNGNPLVLTHWYPSEDELRALIRGAPLQLWVMTTTDKFYPVALTAVEP